MHMYLILLFLIYSRYFVKSLRLKEFLTTVRDGWKRSLLDISSP